MRLYFQFMLVEVVDKAITCLWRDNKYQHNAGGSVPVCMCLFRTQHTWSVGLQSISSLWDHTTDKDCGKGTDTI